MPETGTTEELQKNLENDPFYDPKDTQLDLSSGPKHLADLTDIANETPETPDVPEPTMGELEPPAPPAPEAIPEPQIFNYDDGSKATLEKSNKGWKATLDSGTGAQPEVFYGATKEKLYERLMSAKIQATKKIREQNRSIKLGTNQPQTQPEAPVFRTRTFTAEDNNQLKLQLADNPDLALDNYFQKKTGRSVEELVQMAEEGKRARQELEAEATSREFVESTPDYHGTPSNYQSVVKWISRYKLNKIANEQNFSNILYEIYDRNLWTLAGITEAFEDLRDSGLLELAPLTPAPAVANEEGEETELETPPQPVAPVRRPRPAAGLGIRANEARGTKSVVTEALPTAQSLEDLSDKEIEELMMQVRRQPREAIKASLEKSRQRL